MRKKILSITVAVMLHLSAISQERNRCGDDSLMISHVDWNIRDTTQYIVPRFYTKADRRHRLKMWVKHPGIELKYLWRKYWRRVFPDE